MKISSELVEFIGILLGDGYVHKTENSIIISGSIEDEFYYRYHVLPLVEKIFGVKGTIYFQHERNACYFAVRSKAVISKILSLGFERGKKKFVFPYFMNKKSLYPFILRGLFDTDGCLKFSKQNKNYYYYPRIQLTLSPSNFSRFVSIMLDKLKFNYGSWIDDNSRGFSKKGKLIYYHISGKQNVESWMFKIGTMNPVHRTKYLVWKKYGYYETKTNLMQRCEKLDKKISDIKSFCFNSPVV